MSTALDIISDALSELGVIGASETPNSDDAGFCLRKLNQVLQRWSNLRLNIPATSQISVTLNGAASYTIGPTGNVVASRPLKVLSAYAVDSGGIQHDVNVLPVSEWDRIAQKDITGGPPSDVWYEKTSTNGRIYVYPKSSGYTLKLRCQVLLESLMLNEEVTLPEGYESALTLQLALDIASAFNRQPSPDTRTKAAAAVRVIKRTNAEPLLLKIDESGSDYKIERGY